MKKFVLFLRNFLLLPLVLLRDIHRSQRSGVRKIGYGLLTLLIFGLMWMSGVKATRNFLNFTLYQNGITDKLSHVHVIGSSMLPTIHSGDTVDLNSPKKFGLGRSDIVSFANKETGSAYYIKRIIGLPEDKLSIKNGYVTINDKALSEDYTLDHLPTYGNSFLSDCETITIPKNHFFVMGDNRTVSYDSRALGPIARDDVEGVIKGHIAEKFVTPDLQSKLLSASADPELFLEKLNTERSKKDLPLLVTHNLLNSLAAKRAEQIRDHFSDWKNKSTPLERLLDSSGYRYNLVREYVTFGYLTEQNIVDQMLESGSDKDTILSNQFTEVGIGVTERKDSDCHYPIISIILSWPSIPTYDQKVVDSWLKEISTTNRILSNMQTWVGIAGTDQAKVRAIINSVAQQNQIANRIYNKMKIPDWLSPQDYQDIKTFDALVKESNALMDDFFGQKVKGAFTDEALPRRL